MINLHDYDSLQAALNLSKTRGEPVHVPAGVYNEGALVVSRNASLSGDGYMTHIVGDIEWGTHMGARMSMLRISGTLLMNNARGCVLDQIWWENQENPCLVMQGSSYYNSLRDLQMYGVYDGIIVADRCNDNRIYGGRMYSNHRGLDFKDTANNWRVDGMSFEGRGLNGSIGAHVALRGKKHHFTACRFERGNTNSYDPVAVVLDETTEGCTVRGFFSYGAAVQDAGIGNKYPGHDDGAD